MLELTTREQMIMERFSRADCRFPEYYTPLGWGISNLRAISARERHNFEYKILLAKVILCYPTESITFAPIFSTFALQVESGNLWNSADSLYQKENDRFGGASQQVPLRRCLYYIGAVACGAISFVLVPTVLVRELVHIFRAIQSEPGRKARCSTCGITKTMTKVCPICEHNPQKTGKPSVEDMIVPPSRPEPSTRSTRLSSVFSSSSTSSSFNLSSFEEDNNA